MGRAPCCQDDHGKPGALKKGAWTAEEDEKLLSFIQRNHGHGSWRTVPQLAGLQRCGKSCRLRWTNYLRPNIKRGNFTAEEERVIIQLHGLVGNKWSNIASHLPGRTDNEVKNHWNTHLKKRLSCMGIDPVTHLPFNDILTHLRNHIMQPHVRNSCTEILSPSTFWNPRPCVTRPLQSLPCLDNSFVSHMAQWELARLEAEARLAATSSDGQRSTQSRSGIQTPSCSSTSSASHEYQAASSYNRHILPSFEVPDLDQDNLPALLCSTSNSCSTPSLLSDHFDIDNNEPLLIDYSPSKASSRFDPAPVATTSSGLSSFDHDVSFGSVSTSAAASAMALSSTTDYLQSSCDVISTQANNYWAHMLSLVGLSCS